MSAEPGRDLAKPLAGTTDVTTRVDPDRAYLPARD
jgi:hypothetical protein